MKRPLTSTLFEFRAFIFGSLAAAIIQWVIGTAGSDVRFWTGIVFLAVLWVLCDSLTVTETMKRRGTDQLRLVLREEDFRMLVAGREAKLLEKKTEVRLILEDLGIDRMEKILREENPPF